MFFLLIRRPTAQISLHPQDWLIAAGGSFLPLCVSPAGPPVAIIPAALLLTLGSLLHIGAKLSLNRSFGLVVANRGIKDRGLYRFIRHLMYVKERKGFS